MSFLAHSSSTTGLSCIRSGSPTKRTARSRPRDNVILVCHALSGDARGGDLEDTASGEHARQVCRADRDGSAAKGLGWWDGMIGPQEGLRHGPLFRGVNQSARRLSWDDRALVGEPGVGKTVRHGLSRHYRRRHGAYSGRFSTSSGLSDWPPSPAGRLAGCRRSSGPFSTRTGRCDRRDCQHARAALQGVAWNAIARNAIMADPAWQEVTTTAADVNPTRAWACAHGRTHHLSVGAVTRRQVRPATAVRRRYPLLLREREFEVRNTAPSGGSFVKRFDANTYLYTSRALTYFDLARQRAGRLVDALRRMSARTLLIAFSSDWLYPPSGSQEIATRSTCSARTPSSTSSRRRMRTRLLSARRGSATP